MSKPLGKSGGTALLSCPCEQGLTAVGHPAQSQAALPAPNPATMLGRGTETTGGCFFLPRTHEHARSRQAAANLIQETAKRTRGPAPVPGRECCRCPPLQKRVLAPTGLPARSRLCREPWTSRSPALLTAHQPKEPRRALGRV